MIRYISDAKNVPVAIGPYSQATVGGNLVFLSGQIPLDPTTMELTGKGIEEQTEQVMENIKSALAHLGLGFAQVLKTTIFLTDLANFQTVNGIYEKWLGASKPARSTIQVAGLPRGALIEIEMIAMTE